MLCFASATTLSQEWVITAYSVLGESIKIKPIQGIPPMLPFKLVEAPLPWDDLQRVGFNASNLTCPSRSTAEQTRQLTLNVSLFLVRVTILNESLNTHLDLCPFFFVLLRSTPVV